jgi:hypothetical protein
VELPASVSAKVLRLNEMLRQKVRPAELGRRMGTTPQVVNRLTICATPPRSTTSPARSRHSARRSISECSSSRRALRRTKIVPHIRAAHPENHVLGDIGRPLFATTPL